MAGQVIVDAGLHILERIQSGKHVYQLGEGEKVGLRDEVFTLLWMSKCSNLFTEAIRGIVDKSHQLLCLGDLCSQHLDRFLIDLHTIGLVLGLDLCWKRAIQTLNGSALSSSSSCTVISPGLCNRRATQACTKCGNALCITPRPVVAAYDSHIAVTVTIPCYN